MKKLSLLLLGILLLAGCSLPGDAAEEKQEKQYKIGVLMSTTGLGDDSFNDSAFRGLERARDELGILFDYKEAPDGDLEEKLTELVEDKNDLVIALGFSSQEALEKTAKKYPKQQFLLIDAVSELPNIASITFKEHEGSFLVGMAAAMASKSNTLGFIGGEDAEVIHHFEQGFIEGARHVKPDIKILTEYAGTFSDAELGGKIAEAQIAKGADFIYPAAGFTGYGALQKAQEMMVHAAGVDSDQFFVAEKAIITSMLKNIDVAVYDMAKLLKEKGKIEQHSFVLGLAENGVGLAELRAFPFTEEQKQALTAAKDEIIAGDITVNSTKQ
ncbi:MULTISPECIES: BMP family lipoprotein [Bacillaceae]|uniref:BMP family lipoprotein n=1 Tax=Bacillaceae TaxID=186817 RepID=UPI0014838918|nr:BMP family ABC transporter substrate-binding protein [Bacillus infantis]MCK6206000.1 BMP family ABC transporter substrate-binding protein [Bacillus infantis]MDW2876668.1 BMP family ABC transporter substrate-binding protein [Bacillus infantis]